MGLDIEAPQGVGNTEEQETQRTWDTLDDVWGQLKNAGFWPMEKPILAAPTIDANGLANCTSFQFAQWNMALEGWLAYTLQHINWCSAKGLEYTNERKILSAKIRVRLRKDKPKPSDAAIDDIVLTDHRCIELTRMEQQVDQYKMSLQSQLDHIKAQLRILSRTLSSKTLEAELSGARRIMGGP